MKFRESHNWQLCHLKDGLRQGSNKINLNEIWEKIFRNYIPARKSGTDPDFNYGEYATIRNQAGLNRYKISVKEWTKKTGVFVPKAESVSHGWTFNISAT